MIDIVNRHASAPRWWRIQTAVASGMALLAPLSSPAFAESFIGEWIATAEVPGGGVSETLTVVETDDGYSITAKLVDPSPGMPEASPGIDIVIDGDSFSYKRKLGELEIVYAGVVSGNTFTGSVDIGGARVPYTGIRKLSGN